jgi:ribonuclease BN (tRNA processing enzyme)
MQVTFLGTGSALPIPGRVQTGILLERGQQRLLIDCGSGVLNRLSDTEAGHEGVSTVLLSHHHLDHVADLLPLMKARWLAGQDAIEIVGPSGTTALIDGLLDVHEYMQDRIDIAVREITPGTVEVGGFTVDAIETRHSMQCHAYRVAGPEDDFTFSGDSEAFGELAAFADGSTVLAHDCSFPDGAESPNHPTPSQLGHVLAGTDIGRVYLTHLYPDTVGAHREMVESVRQSFDGAVAVAEDGLQIHL